MKPSFLILGAGKSGTTSLYEYMKQHPNVYMAPAKETHFFEWEEYEKGMEFYWNEYFKGWSGEQAVGEASTPYLYLPYVPKRIKKTIPEARLIAILRNPVDRAYSHWWMEFSRGLEKLPFEDAIQKNLKRIERGITCDGEKGKRLWHEHRNYYSKGILRFRIYIDQGYYAQQIKRYLGLFSKSQIKILLLEDLSKPKSLAKELWGFIGVDPTVTLENTKEWNVAYGSRVVRRSARVITSTKLHKFIPKQIREKLKITLSRIGNRPKMNPETRKWLIEHYHQHNRELEALLERDLSHWDK